MQHQHKTTLVLGPDAGPSKSSGNLCTVSIYFVNLLHAILGIKKLEIHEVTCYRFRSFTLTYSLLNATFLQLPDYCSI